MTDWNSWPFVQYTAEFQKKVNSSKVLCIGAGGIGCELLKTLVLQGFRNIEVIDLDTIETSNLNRQFLFQKKHVGQSKAVVAAESVSKLVPQAKVVAHQGNVKEERFGFDFFSKFDVVLNGLDNMEARKHVNRLCIATGVPLVESGTAGYEGQVSVHLKGKSECYECIPKRNTNKQYPICTIRNTPEKPIHCIVWAKELLFVRFFGPQSEMMDLDDNQYDLENLNGSDNAQAGNVVENGVTDVRLENQVQEDSNQKTEKQNGTTEWKSQYLRNCDEDSWEYAIRIFQKVYQEDIEDVWKKKNLWETRNPPVQILLKNYFSDSDLNDLKLTKFSEKHNFSVSKQLNFGEEQNWSIQDNIKIFLNSIRAFHEKRKSQIGDLEFDKEDDLIIDFITSSSNLRSFCYSIPMQTFFDVKGMAGSIIHAVATTNAIIAGLIVIEAQKVISGDIDACRFQSNQENYTVSRKYQLGRLITSHQLDPPKADCLVCGNSSLTIKLNVNQFIFKKFVDIILKKEIGFVSPSVFCDEFMYEEGDDLEEDEVKQNQKSLQKILSSLPGGGIKNGTMVRVEDDQQKLAVSLRISHVEQINEDQYPDGFIIEGEISQMDIQENNDGSNDVIQEQQLLERDGAIFIDHDLPRKRKRDIPEEFEAGPSSSKAIKIVQDDDVICLTD